MNVQSFSCRELNRYPSAVRKASDSAPVFITVRGTPKTVMLSYSCYQRLVENAHRRTLFDVFSKPGFENLWPDIDLEVFISQQKGTAAAFD